ncbi:MAG TPA: cell division protein ZapA [Sphingomonas sp.]|nr:cell division protein ZapA [Sphingomonas sp.]
MAEVMLTIGGRQHSVLCRDGEEAQVERLGRMLDERWADADRAAGGLSAERAMMFVALMLADDLDELRRNPPGSDTSAPTVPPGLADRLERIAAALEESAPAS